MKNEKIMIFGDSYSTYKGWIPEGYSPYYPKDAQGLDLKLEETWWHRLLKETDSELLLNDSWSGTTMCNMGYDGDCSKTHSFIFRLERLIDSGFFKDNEIDRVFVFGGTNDGWNEKSSCGEHIFENWKEEDKKFIFPGISYFLYRLLTVVQKEKVHFIINTFGPKLKGGIIEICNHFNIGYTELEDIDKIGGHPTAKGMEQIKDQVLINLK